MSRPTAGEWTPLLVILVGLATAACRGEAAGGDAVPEETPDTATAGTAADPGQAPAGDAAPSRDWTFDTDETGTIPAGWTVGESNGAGTPATWATVARDDAPSAPGTFGVTATRNYGHTFNVALAQGTSARDLDLSVRVKAVSGEEDQGGGLVWRAADASNYYITRWNPLEKNFRVYFVKDGRRKQLATAPATDDVSTWHTVSVVTRGSHIDCLLDGAKLLSVDDETFSGPGQVGLWTKADAATLFDDLHLEVVAP